jgi:hypothetical protein
MASMSGGVEERAAQVQVVRYHDVEKMMSTRSQRHDPARNKHLNTGNSYHSTSSIATSYRMHMIVSLPRPNEPYKPYRHGKTTAHNFILSPSRPLVISLSFLNSTSNPSHYAIPSYHSHPLLLHLLCPNISPYTSTLLLRPQLPRSRHLPPLLQLYASITLRLLPRGRQMPRKLSLLLALHRRNIPVRLHRLYLQCTPMRSKVSP